MTQEKQSIITTELADLLQCSQRTLKEDLAYFRNAVLGFTIESSYEGVKISFKPKSGIKAFYQNILKDSLNYKVLEIILFDEQVSIEYLTNTLYICVSMLNPLVTDIDIALLSHFNIHLTRNTFQLDGDEE